MSNSALGTSKSNGDGAATHRRDALRQKPGVESLEGRALMTGVIGPGDPTPGMTAAQVIANDTNNPTDPIGSPAFQQQTVANQLTGAQVEQILDRASAAVPDQTAIITVVDRSGRLLGARVENGVSPVITNNTANLVFAVDGSLALARTGAFFGNDQAPLTSRTIQNLSESTILQREVQSVPSITDPNSTLKGPGLVAPVGIKGHFPPGIPFTPQVDLFEIELTNRDTSINPYYRNGTSATELLPNRFNVPDQYAGTQTVYNPATGQNVVLPGIPAPDSYGEITGLEPLAQPRGIGTLPGGLPIEKTVVVNGKKQQTVIGGIGVFYPGTTGYATEENSVLNDALYNPSLPDKSSEAEVVGFAALGGASAASLLVGKSTRVGALDGIPPVPGLDLLPSSANVGGQYGGRIDLVGITLDVFGPHGDSGPNNLLIAAGQFKLGSGTVNGYDLPINAAQAAANPIGPKPVVTPVLTTAGTAVPQGWLVLPHAGGDITQQDVINIVADGIVRADETRAAIRLPLNRHARMIFSVSDLNGNLLGVYRMPDATIFSEDVAVAKSRNVAYYDNPANLQPVDKLAGVAPGVSFTNRTFRYLSLPYYPEGQDDYPSGPFSILNDGQTTVAAKGANVGAALPASAFTSVLGYDAFNPGTNFHDPSNLANQDGIVFFPGSVALYKSINGVSTIVGGLGVSGDGVDQDDVVTYSASRGYRPQAPVVRADMIKVRGVRLPYQKFNRDPKVG